MKTQTRTRQLMSSDQWAVSLTMMDKLTGPSDSSCIAVSLVALRVTAVMVLASCKTSVSLNYCPHEQSSLTLSPAVMTAGVEDDTVLTALFKPPVTHKTGHIRFLIIATGIAIFNSYKDCLLFIEIRYWVSYVRRYNYVSFVSVNNDIYCYVFPSPLSVYPHPRARLCGHWPGNPLIDLSKYNASA